jgi:hypothetical protein
LPVSVGAFCVHWRSPFIGDAALMREHNLRIVTSTEQNRSLWRKLRGNGHL